MKHKPKLVIFDMDGLMFDSERVAFDALRRLFNEMGSDIDHEEYLTLIGRSNADFFDYYEKKFPGHDHATVDSRALELISVSYRENGVPLKDGLFELLDYLDQNGIKKAVATSSSRSIATEALQIAGVYERFDGFIFGDSVTHSKPNPEIFELICDSLTDSRADALILEDSRNGILAAQAAGIPVIMVPDLIPPTEELLAIAAHKCDSLFGVIDFLSNLPD